MTTREDILNALKYIEGQLESGYLDIGFHDDLEMDIVSAAIAEFKANHRLTKFDILD